MAAGAVSAALSIISIISFIDNLSIGQKANETSNETLNQNPSETNDVSSHNSLTCEPQDDFNENDDGSDLRRDQVRLIEVMSDLEELELSIDALNIDMSSGGDVLEDARRTIRSINNYMESAINLAAKCVELETLAEELRENANPYWQTVENEAKECYENSNVSDFRAEEYQTIIKSINDSTSDIAQLMKALPDLQAVNISRRDVLQRERDLLQSINRNLCRSEVWLREFGTQ